MTLRDELEAFASDGGEAFALTDRWITRIINTLLRDRCINLKRFEVELLLADERALIEQQLFRLLVNRVHLDHVDVIDGIEP